MTWVKDGNLKGPKGDDIPSSVLDGKLDKVTTEAQRERAYVVMPDGSQTVHSVTDDGNMIATNSDAIVTGSAVLSYASERFAASWTDSSPVKEGSGCKASKIFGSELSTATYVPAMETNYAKTGTLPICGMSEYGDKDYAIMNRAATRSEIESAISMLPIAPLLFHPSNDIFKVVPKVSELGDCTLQPTQPTVNAFVYPISYSHRIATKSFYFGLIVNGGTNSRSFSYLTTKTSGTQNSCSISFDIDISGFVDGVAEYYGFSEHKSYVYGNSSFEASCNYINVLYQPFDETTASNKYVSMCPVYYNQTSKVVTISPDIRYTTARNTGNFSVRLDAMMVGYVRDEPPE